MLLNLCAYSPFVSIFTTKNYLSSSFDSFTSYTAKGSGQKQNALLDRLKEANIELVDKFYIIESIMANI